MGWSIFQSVKNGLSRTRESLQNAFTSLLSIGRKVDEAFLEELEETLILSDVGPRLALEMTEDVRRAYKNREIKQVDEIISFLKDDLIRKLVVKDSAIKRAESGPTVIIFVGVNGTGKTTTTAKLASRYSKEGYKVLLAAADTFRAAAGEQLEIWANRLGVEIVRHRDGADPGAVVYDACEAAIARCADYLIIDTAGRLHTKENLMRELEKIKRIAEKKIGSPPHEILLVLDATTGQNALSQASMFAQGVGLTGLVLTKLDGTAKGGIVVAITRLVDLPIKLIGVGEGQDDLADFDPKTFIDAMFSGISVVQEGVEATEEGGG